MLYLYEYIKPSQRSYQGIIIIIPILQGRKGRHRDNKQLAQDHRAIRWQSRDSAPDGLLVEPVLFLPSLALNVSPSKAGEVGMSRSPS